MPFLTGTTVDNFTNDFPWKANGDFDIIKSNVNYLTHSSKKTAQSYIKQDQITSMLYILKYYNKTINSFIFDHFVFTLSTDEIDNLNTEGSVPHTLTPRGYNNYSYNNKTYPGFKIVESNKNNKHFFELIDKYISFKEEKQISMVLQESISHKVRVYHEVYEDRKEHYYTIVTSNWTWDMARKLIGLMPLLYPEYTIPDEVKPIFQLFGTDKYEEWETTYFNWIKVFNLGEQVRLENLKKAFTYTYERKKTDLQKNISSYTTKIDEYINVIRSYYTNIQNWQYELFGLENQKTVDVLDFCDYLMKNKAIHHFEVSDYYLYLTLRTSWNYYDAAAFKKIMGNRNSNVNQNPALAEFYNLTFNDNPRFEIWTDTRLYINLSNNEFRVDAYDKCELLPQIHLHFFNCFGNNKGYIQKALSSGHYMEAIEQMIASTKNINWFDGPVIDYTNSILPGDYKNRKTIKDLKTEKFISYKEAIQIIKEEKENALHQDNTDTTAINA